MIKYISSLVFLLLLYGCKTFDQRPVDHLLEVNNELCQQYWIENRIADCNSSIVLMESIIAPVKGSLKLMNTNDDNHIGNLSIRIKGDVNSRKLKQLGRYYVNINCLSNIEYDKLLSMLIDESDFMKYSNLLLSPKNRIALDVCIAGMECFSIVLFNKEVVEISWHLVQSN